MPYPPKIIVHCTSGSPRELEVLVEEFLKDAVKFVGVVGKEAAYVEELIDEIVVGDGTDESRFLLTVNHAGKSLQDALEFAGILSNEYAGDVQVIEV